MDMEWAERVLSARGYRIERFEIKPSRVLFKIGDLFLFADELQGLAAGDYSLEELEARKNPWHCLK
jgi:hypothetical protein